MVDKRYKNLRANLFILFVFCALLACGQTTIDNTLSVDFPGKADTSAIKESNIAAKTWTYNTDKESYVLLRVALLDKGEELKENPPDSGKLFEIYSHDITNQIASMKRKGFVFKDSARINIQNYIGYKLTYVDGSSAIQNAEAVLLFLNGIRYAIIYSKISEFNQRNKDKFLSSVRISGSESVQQIEESKQAEKPVTDTLFFKTGLYLLIITGVIIWLRQKTKNNSKSGINLKRVICPVCNTKQPIIRMPDSKEQALYGGTTCPNCHTKLDKYGNIIT